MLTGTGLSDNPGLPNPTREEYLNNDDYPL